MGTTIYIRLSDEESELIKSVSGRRHNLWARRVLLREAARVLPIEEVRRVLEQAGISPERQTWILARFAEAEN